MTNDAPLYELREVTKTYGAGETAVHALRDVTLTIDSGELVAVVGQSGSGKTTLLQLLGGLDRPTSGAVRFEGRDLDGLRDAELTRLRLDTIGFVFQQFNLVPTVTAAENVELALAPRGVRGQALTARSASLLDAVGLAHRRDHLPSQLSGGEQQRVAIARALANDPRVLLADEPTGNLDTTTGEEILALLRSLSVERGQTVVLITHDPGIASTATRVVRLRDGSIVPDDRRVEAIAG